MTYQIRNANKQRLVGLLEQHPRVAYWQVAEVLGCHENTITRWMRCPDDDQAQVIEDAIKIIRDAK